jgi:hypothetical protein
MHLLDKKRNGKFLERAKSRKGLMRFLDESRTQSSGGKLACPKHAVKSSKQRIAIAPAVARNSKRPFDVSTNFTDEGETQDYSSNLDNSRAALRTSETSVCKWMDSNTLGRLVGTSSAIETTVKYTLASPPIERRVVDDAKRMEAVVFDEMLKLKQEIEQCEVKLNNSCEKLNTLRSTEAVQVSALKAECAAKVCSLEESLHRLDVEINRMDRDRSAAEEELSATKFDLKHRIEQCGLSQDTQEIDVFRSAVLEDLEKLLKPARTNRNGAKFAELRAKRSSIKEQLREASDDYKRRRLNLPIVLEVQDLQARHSILCTELDWLRAKYSELAHHAKGMH